MTNDPVQCWACGATSACPEIVGRSSHCPHCQRDWRVCRQCRHHAPGKANDCNEPAAERVADPARANFCDWFQVALVPHGKAVARTAHEDAALAALFDLNVPHRPAAAPSLGGIEARNTAARLKVSQLFE